MDFFLRIFKRFLCALLCISLVFSPVFAEPLDTSILPQQNEAPSVDTTLSLTPDNSNPIYTPTIDKAPNDVPIINITTPDNLGISNNHYLDFNVKENGAIINNSNNPITPTELAGFITSNPNLNDKVASLILNQVTSTSPSKLLGMLEIAGTKAGLLIANPNGISCQGCSFSNATSVSLTTGLIPPSELLALEQLYRQGTSTSSVSNLKQELISNLHLRVTRGHINLDSLNSLNIPILNILSESLSISGANYARNLSIILGSNDISLDQKGALLLWQPMKGDSNEESPSKLALDVAYIGGVYANSIYLVASKEDAIIKNSGVMATFASNKPGDGGFVIDASGHLIIQNHASEVISPDGSIANDSSTQNPPSGIYAFNYLAIKAKSLQNNSVIQSNEDLSIHIQEDFVNQGSIVSFGVFDISSASLKNINALMYGDMLISNTGVFSNQNSGFILGKNIALNSTEISNQNSLIYASESLNLQAKNISNIAQIQLKKQLTKQEHIKEGRWDEEKPRFLWFVGPTWGLKDGDKDFERLIYEEVLDNSSYLPSIMGSAGEFVVQADVFSNQDGSLIAPVSKIVANTFDNHLTQAREITEDKGREARNYQDVWYERECKGLDYLTLCIVQTDVRHEKTRLGIFDDYHKESFAFIPLALPSLEEDLTSYLKNPYVKLKSSIIEGTQGDFSPSSSIKIFDDSHLMEFGYFDPYVLPDENPSVRDTSSIYTDAKAFISSSYFYERFKNIQDVPAFLAHLQDFSQNSNYLFDFYNSKLFLDESLHLKTQNIILASIEQNHLANKNNASTDRQSVPTGGFDAFGQTYKGIYASSVFIKGASFYNDAYIFAKDTQILAQNNLFNSGDIESDDLVLSTEGKLYHSGSISAKNALLDADDMTIASTSTTFRTDSSKNTLDNSSNHSKEKILKTASITGDNLLLKSSGDVNISGALLSAKEELSVAGDMVFIATKELGESYEDSFKSTQNTRNQKSALLGSDITIAAKEGLSIKGSEFSATNNLTIYSQEDIYLLASSDDNSSKKDFYDEKTGFLTFSKSHHSIEKSSTSQEGNVFRATNINLKAKGNIIANGGEYEAKHQLNIIADKDYIQSALYKTSTYANSHEKSDEVLGFDFAHEENGDRDTSRFYTNSSLSAKDIFVQTGGNTTFLGAQINAQESTSIIAKGSFSLSNPKNTYVQNHRSSSDSWFGLFGDEGTSNHEQNNQNISTITSKTLNINAHEDVNLLASHISTSGDVFISSDVGNINIKNDYNQASNHSTSSSKSFDKFTFSLKEKLSVGMDFKYSDESSQDSQKMAMSSAFDVLGNIVLKTGDGTNEGGDINIIASDITSAKNIILDSKNIHIYSDFNTSNSSTQSTQGHLNTSVNIGNAYADVYFSSDRFYKSLENFNQLQKEYKHNKELYEQGKISKNALDEFKYNLGFASLNIANASLGVVSSISAAASSASSSYGTGFYASVSTDISGSQTNTLEQNASVISSNLKAGENIIALAKEDISQIGSHLSAKENIIYEAKNNIRILSSDSTHKYTKEKRDFSTTTSYGNNGFMFDAQVGGSKERELSSDSYDSTLSAKNISLSSAKDTLIKGGTLASVDANITADNLSIISPISSKYSHMNAGSISGGYGSSSVDMGFSKDKGNSDREWVENQSGIFAQNALKVNIAHHTYLEGAYLLSKVDNLSLSTDTFSYEDKENKDYLSSKGINLSVQSDNKALSNSNTQINLSHQGSITEGKTLATLGKGEIHINHSPNVINTINTDISKSTSITKDQTTGLLNINTQIDNRFFSSQGREAIYHDIISLPSNLIKTTNGAFTLAFNPLLSTAEVLLNPDISLTEIINQWKANQSTAVAINNLDRDTLNQLSSGKNIDEIESSIKGENQDKVHIYYDETDNLNGFYDNKNKQIYLNAANNAATNTKTFVATYTHENAHQFTHNDSIANNAGSYGRFSYSLSNLLGFTSINTKGRTTTNHNNISTTAPISSKQWYQNQSNNIGFAGSKAFGGRDGFTGKNKDNPSNHDNSTSNNFKDILDYNNHQASLVEEGDRDKNAAAIVGTGALGLETCAENPVGCAIIGVIGTGVFLYEAWKDGSSKDPKNSQKENKQPQNQANPQSQESDSTQKHESSSSEKSGEKQSQGEKKAEENTQKKTNPKKEPDPIYQADIKTNTKSRSSHRNQANKQLHNDLKNDSDLKNDLNNKLGGDVQKHMESGKGNLKNPPNSEWHHPKEQENNLNLLDKQIHRDFHKQDGNKKGGFDQNYKRKNEN